MFEFKSTFCNFKLGSILQTLNAGVNMTNAGVNMTNHKTIFGI